MIGRDRFDLRYAAVEPKSGMVEVLAVAVHGDRLSVDWIRLVAVDEPPPDELVLRVPVPFVLQRGGESVDVESAAEIPQDLTPLLAVR